MISVRFNSTQFAKEMNSITNYAVGFIDGVNAGRPLMLATVGEKTKEILEQFIDANARTDAATLQHVYEWYQVGSPSARLFDIDYIIYRGGLTFKSTFRQSQSIKSGSKTPFYDKAMIMEQGIPVKIRPKSAEALAFDVDGKTVFTKKEVKVDSPGGDEAQGGFQKTVDTFFNSFYSQAFLRVSGLSDRLSNPVTFKKNLPAAKRGGRAKGFDVGYRWITAKEVL